MFNFDIKFFERQQKRLLYIANSFWLRWLLGLNRLPERLKSKKFKEIGVNYLIEEGFSLKNHKLQNEGYFFTRPRFAEALAFNLSPFTYLMNNRQTKMVWRLSPIGALGLLACLLFPKLLGGFAFIGYTDYPVGAGDGWIRYDTTEGGDNWNNAVNSAVAAGNNKGVGYDTDSAISVAGYISAGGRVQIYRGLFPVDTSGLGSGAVVSAAIMFLYAVIFWDGDNDAQGYTAIVSQNSATTDAIVLADYGTFGTTLFSDKIDNTGGSTVAYTQFTMTAAGLTAISKTGYTKFGVREGHDIENSAPAVGGDNGAAFYPSETAGTDYDPYLRITYTTPSVGTHRFFQMF